MQRRVVGERMTGEREDSEALRRAIVTRGLSKRYGRRLVVDDVSLVVPGGSAMALVGRNAAGKTTLLRMVLGLVRPSAGEAVVAGRPVRRGRGLPPVGSIVEEPTFDLDRSARRNLIRLVALGTPALPGAVERALERAGLSRVAGVPVRQFSQGMRQRLGLAAALLRDPPALVLDEPTNGMDPAGMRLVREVIADCRAEGRAVLVASHLLSEMQASCDLLAVIRDGALVFNGQIAAATGARRRIRVEVEPDETSSAMSALAGTAASVLRAGVIEIDTSDGRAVNRRLVAAGVFARSVLQVQSTLEDFVSDLEDPGRDTVGGLSDRADRCVPRDRG
jgi:ABC-type multidrug transport system ATPase subunit